MRTQSSLRLQCTDQRLEGGVEGHTKGIADRLENVATFRFESRAEHPVMGGERHPHGVRVLFPFLGTAFDIGEEKGDSAGRQRRHDEGECVRA